MLGELIGEMMGTETGRRVLPDGTIEQSVQGSGRLSGTEISFLGTTVISPRPDGTATGGGQFLATTKDGETVLGRNSGVGIPKGPAGAASIRGVFYWQTQSQKLARLNQTVGVFEAEQDAQGNIVGKVWEWK
jgi:hypothetical protein